MFAVEHDQTETLWQKAQCLKQLGHHSNLAVTAMQNQNKRTVIIAAAHFSAQGLIALRKRPACREHDRDGDHGTVQPISCAGYVGAMKLVI